MTSRRRFLVGLGVASLSTTLPAFAQQAGKIPKVGVLWPAHHYHDHVWTLGSKRRI
jgi:hypothetical protein